ncbi:MAG: DUF1631 family protein [Rhodanobacter sp.]
MRLQCGHRPERAQYLIEASYKLCTEALRELLQPCFDNFEQQLFAMAEGAHSAAERQDHLACRHYVLRMRKAFEQHFINRLTAEFNAFDERATTSIISADTKGRYALQQLIARGEMQHRRVLYDLAHRFAVLVAAPPLKRGVLPFGPRALAHGFQHASMELNLSAERHVLWLGSFSQTVIQTLAPLYDAIDQQLQSAGILPQLRLTAAPARNYRQRQLNAAASDAGRTVTATAPADSLRISLSMTSDALESIRDLLALQGGYFGPALRQVSACVASDEDIQRALMKLQRHSAYLDVPGNGELRSTSQLREDLLNELNAERADDALDIQLTQQQNSALELIGLLFEQLSQQLSHNDAARTLMHRLQLPILRMAIADQNFFQQPNHPAQQLLGTVTTATNDWLDGDDSQASQPLASQWEQIVDRAWREPASADLYVNLLADIQPHLSLLTRTAKASERHYVEALQFNERMTSAQLRAAELMAERCVKSPALETSHALLVRCWTDALALTLFRHGEHSDVFHAQMAITDQLLGLLPVVDLAQLQREVETGLQQIGISTRQASNIAQQLCEAGTHDRIVGSHSTSDTTEAADGHQDYVRPTGATLTLVDTSTPRAAYTQPAPDSATDASEQQIEQRLRTLPFGTWLEMIDPTSSASTLRKLTWYSRISGTCLLVSRGGQYCAQTTLAQLAREIARGRMREVPARRGSVLDYAWHNLANKLRAQSSAKQNTESAPHS